MREFFDTALAAIDPERLTREALEGTALRDPVTIVAIGKAAPAMARGAAATLGRVNGVCVTNHNAPVPDGIELIVGDHPVPGERSFAAGRRVLELVGAAADGTIVALISGGGSSLCEHPREGVPEAAITDIATRLVDSGAAITDINLVRRHLSAIKGGGLLSAAKRPIETFAISDVLGSDPAVIASGPTIPQDPDPDGALEVMSRLGIEVVASVKSAISRPPPTLEAGNVTLLADGSTAIMAIVEAASQEGIEAELYEHWISGPVEEALDRFMDAARVLRVGAGEPEVGVSGDGVGGRNTHAALLAAVRIEGTDALFAALATDGADGNSGSAGAIVDGTTLARGGDPSPNLARSDSARYLESTGDLVVTGPTGTNVADLWLLWP